MGRSVAQGVSGAFGAPVRIGRGAWKGSGGGGVGVVYFDAAILPRVIRPEIQMQYAVVGWGQFPAL